MKLRKIVFAIAVATLLAMPVAGQEKSTPPDSSAAAPKMVIESLTHDFGEVKAGTPLRHAFKVKNIGKADLLIQSVSPG